MLQTSVRRAAALAAPASQQRAWCRIVAALLPVLVVSACTRGNFATARAPIPDSTACAPLPVVTPASVGLDPAAVDSLQRAAVAMKSDALLILRDGKIVHEWTDPDFRMPFNPQSIGKAVTALGVGVLLDRGQIPSLDLPLADVFPEFRTGDKQAVTLRHLLTHTSGIAAGRGEAQFQGVRDVGAWARAQPMAEPAGTVFRYSNVGAQLVSHLVQARAGAPLHAVLDSAIFAPLCVRDWRWETDEAGASYGYSRVQLTARDLAKLGQLMLDGGSWQGRRVLQSATVDSLTARHGGPVRSLAAATMVGLWQYWGGDSVRVDTTLLTRLAAIPVSDTLLATVRRIVGPGGARTMPQGAFRVTLDSAFGADSGVRRWYRETRGTVLPERWRTPAQAFGHSGSWGQWLLVYPETRTVVVRLARWDHEGRTAEDDGYEWGGIVGEAYRLVGRRPTSPSQ